ncbi:regulator of G-protein signaling 1-like [Apus apus]|uniref:regulator of G-protein signaling 1-like n=1 Tax=Apus apus TaxID=8895 RepID=UPI0021F883CA|nr:regulator of G-protein signaling 1-like [Apus apus]
MLGFFFPHNNMTELNGKEDCKHAEGKIHKKKQKAFGTDLKSYLKCMVPHIESGIKTSNSKTVILSAEEVIQWSQSLEKLLASQSGQGVFREFLKSEFSEENIEFWLACEDYKKSKSDHLQCKAERIYEEFVQSDAIKQINIDHQIREATAKKAQDPTRTSFDEVQKTVYILMERDSYPRFLKSKAYLKLLNQLQTNTSK